MSHLLQPHCCYILGNTRWTIYVMTCRSLQNRIRIDVHFSWVMLTVKVFFLQHSLAICGLSLSLFEALKPQRGSAASNGRWTFNQLDSAVITSERIMGSWFPFTPCSDCILLCSGTGFFKQRCSSFRPLVAAAELHQLWHHQCLYLRRKNRPFVILLVALK